MPRGNYRQYDAALVDEAATKVRAKQLSAKRASQVYGIPRTTLLDRVYQRVEQGTTRSGPPPVLTEAEESLLNEWARKMARIGYPVPKYHLQTEVKKLLDKDGRQTPFKDNLPGIQIKLIIIIILSYNIVTGYNTH
jgi:hypothetical protein